CYLGNSTVLHAYPLPLHDALPISRNFSFSAVSTCPGPAAGSVLRLRRSTLSNQAGSLSDLRSPGPVSGPVFGGSVSGSGFSAWRSEEHTSELQSRENLVCRLLLEK